MIIKNQNIQLMISPERGGSITAFQWRGIDIFRKGNDDSTNPLEQSSFGMVPYSGRIGHGNLGGKIIPLNRPDVDPLHPLHGTGWVNTWDIISKDSIVHHHDGSEWFGPFVAKQRFILNDDVFRHELEITNTGNAPLPCGLGLHPYFPRTDAKAIFHLDAMWENNDDRLPVNLEPISSSFEYLGDLHIDNCFTGLNNNVVIQWPKHQVTMTADPDLNHAVIYCPKGEDYFCVEPVSHRPDPIKQGGLRVLHPGESWCVKVDFTVSAVL